jgi:predicted RNA-binding protein YlxR (DUF448 family)
VSLTDLLDAGDETEAEEGDKDIVSRGARKTRDKPVRERRCVATGETAGPDRLLRVALSPDGVVTPDLAARLPGRGAWISADRALIDKAVEKRLFNRAFEKPVEAPDDWPTGSKACWKRVRSPCWAWRGVQDGSQWGTMQSSWLCRRATDQPGGSKPAMAQRTGAASSTG